MLIIFNLRGLVCLILAIALSLAPSQWFPGVKVDYLVVLAALLIVLDGLHRWFVVRKEIAKELTTTHDETPILKRSASLVWFLSGLGASVMFLPMWIWGVILIMLNLWLGEPEAP